MDKATTNNLNDLKKLSDIINEARTSFNDIVVEVCNHVADNLKETFAISFDEVEVDQYDGFMNGINGYCTTYKDFFCDDPNETIRMEELTTDSIVKAMDTIIKTAKPYTYKGE